MVLENRLEAIEQGRMEVMRYLARSRLSDAVRDRLDVVFEEVVANIVRYAFPEGGYRRFIVKVDDGRDTIDLTFIDDGVPFDPTQGEAPEQARDIVDARIGGNGVPLLRAFTRSLAYARISGALPEGPFKRGGADRNMLKAVIDKAEV